MDQVREHSWALSIALPECSDSHHRAYDNKYDSEEYWYCGGESQRLCSKHTSDSKLLNPGWQGLESLASSDISLTYSPEEDKGKHDKDDSAEQGEFSRVPPMYSKQVWQDSQVNISIRVCSTRDYVTCHHTAQNTRLNLQRKRL